MPFPFERLQDADTQETVIDSGIDIEIVQARRNVEIDVDSTLSKISLLATGSIIAAAAVVLFWVVLPRFTAEDQSLPQSTPVAFELASINRLEVEELNVEDGIMVQFYQQDENAPTIIFIDEMVDDIENSGDEE